MAFSARPLGDILSDMAQLGQDRNPYLDFKCAEDQLGPLRAHGRIRPTWLGPEKIFFSDPGVPEGKLILVPSGVEVGAIWQIQDQTAAVVFDPDRFIVLDVAS